jgi:hypothetical protein
MTYCILMDLPLWVVTDVIQLPLAPSKVDDYIKKVQYFTHFWSHIYKTYPQIFGINNII